MEFKFKDNKDCFVIAEAGVNHNGSLSIAKNLVDEASRCGANAIKFQTFKSVDLVIPSAPKTKYQNRNVPDVGSQFEMLQKLELRDSEFEALKQHCDKRRILFLSTPHTCQSALFLDKLVPFFKIGSGDITNLPMLQEISQMQKPIILSTGMSTLEEINDALKSIMEMGNSQIILLHCTSNYPCPLNMVNLRAMKTIKQRFGLQVGYSDHTEGIDVSLMAVKLGAIMIEKHFTLDKSLEGPDHVSSLNPQELGELVNSIRSGAFQNIQLDEVVLGSVDKIPNPEELATSNLVRKSIVASRSIKTGARFTRENISIKRPGIGLPPKELPNIIGKKARRSFKKNDFIEK